jgi:DNA-binding NarL/FixJ family response regulator
MTIKVYLIEDHPLLLRMLSEFINKLPGLTMCGCATSGREALKQLPRLKADLVLVDICLPDMNGIDIVEKLHVWCPELPILILSAQQGVGYVRSALAVGARGYIIKGEPLEIGEAIHNVLAGETYLSPQLQQLAT